VNLGHHRSIPDPPIYYSHHRYPGMYGMMMLSIQVPESAPLVSDDAPLPRSHGIRTGGFQFSRRLAPVTLGYDNGYAVEATSGISMNDQIAVNLGQSAIDGERVQAVQQRSP
jgi:hypothetical protein